MRLSSYKFLGLLLAGYLLFIFVPLFPVVFGQEIFGADIGQYALTARLIMSGRSNIFYYPSPLLPVIYIPIVSAISDPVIVFRVADVITGILMVSLAASVYFLSKSFSLSDFAAAIAGLTLGTFPLILDEIGWGGQAQYLAMILGTLALAAIIPSLSTQKRNLKKAALTGALLAMSSLADLYAALYFVMVLVFLFLLVHRKHILARQNFVAQAIVFLPSIISVAGLQIVQRIAFSSVPLAPMLFQINDYNPWLLLIRITYGNYGLLVSDAEIALTFLVWKRKLAGTIGPNLLAASTLALAIQILLLTPGQYADRGLYFIPFPLAMAAGLGAQSVAAAVKRYSGLGLSFKNLVYHPKASDLSCGLLLLTIFFSAGIAFSTYSNSLKFYSIDSHDLSGLTQLRGSLGSIVDVTSSGWVFARAYATETNVLRSMQPVWFVRTDQIEASEFAQHLSWGTSWIQAGDLAVVDSAPAGSQPSPALYVGTYPYSVEVFRLSDGLMPVIFSPTSNASIVWGESPSYAPSITSSYLVQSILHSYLWQFLRIDKSVTLNDNGTVAINLRYSFRNSIPDLTKVRFISFDLVHTQAQISKNDNSSAVIQLEQSYQDPWLIRSYNTRIEVKVQNATIDSEFYHDEWGMPEILSSFHPLSSEITQMSLQIRATVEGVKVGPVQLIHENAALRQWNVEWVIVGKDVHPSIISRFQNDPVFKPASETTYYYIFKNAAYGEAA